MLDTDELVRIHFYDGSLYDEEHTYVCISASQLPEIDRLVTRSVYTGLAVTTIETVALVVPGRLITAAIQRTGRSVLLGTLLGLSEVIPEVVAQGTLNPVVQTTVRSATGAVVTQTLEQTAVRAAAEGATEQVVASTAARAGTTAPVRLGSQTATALAGKTAAVGAAEGVGAQVLEAPSVSAPAATAPKVLFTSQGFRVVTPHVVYSKGTLSAAETQLVAQVETRLVEIVQQAIKNVESKLSSTKSASALYKTLPSDPYYGARLGSAIHEEAFEIITKEIRFEGNVLNKLRVELAVKKGIPVPRSSLVGYYEGLIPDIRMSLSGSSEIVWDITTPKQVGKAIKYQQPFVVEIRELLY